MTTSTIIQYFGYGIYGALALLAIWGIYNSVLLNRSLNRKSLSNKDAETLMGQIRELSGSKAGQEAAIKLCQSPTYWDSAIGQLISVAIANRLKGLAKVKSMLVMEFHTEVVAKLEIRLASISTIVRMGPLLGLLGTVASMIAAFGRISGEKVNPSELAGEISLALWATGAGLLIATPMMIFGNSFHARLRNLRDRTERQLQDFIDILEATEQKSGRHREARSVILSK